MLIGMDLFVGLIQDLRASRDRKDLQRRINCPQYGKVMDTHPYGGPGNVIIDDCDRCEVNWLDYGELQRIVRAPERHYGE
jgi:Transcription factor zinc-finger